MNAAAAAAATAPAAAAAPAMTPAECAGLPSARGVVGSCSVVASASCAAFDTNVVLARDSGAADALPATGGTGTGPPCSSGR